MKKKILSMVMAAAMVLSVSSVSQAAVTEQDGKYTITVGSEVETPTIAVTLSDEPTGRKVVINPYGLASTKTADVTDNAAKAEQLVNKVQSIKNTGLTDLAVNVTLQATPSTSGKAKIATAKVLEGDKNNSVFAFLKVEKGTVDKAGQTMTNVDYDSKTAKADGTVVFTTKETTTKEVVVLDDKDASTGNVYANYKIMGNAAPNPTTPWAAADTIDFKIVFDFEPRVITSTNS